MTQSLFLNSSVVLIAPNQIPQVSHDFLMNKKIIPNDDFVIQPENSFNVPPLTRIQYKNGFSIIIEQNSKALFQVTFNKKNENAILSDLKCLKQISSNFFNSFENIPHQAIGINFDVIVKGLQYDSFMQNFINSDNSYLKFDGNECKINNINLSYKIKGKHLNIQVIKLEKVNENTSNKNFIPLFKINIHYPQNYTDNKINIMDDVEKNYKLSKKFIERF